MIATPKHVNISSWKPWDPGITREKLLHENNLPFLLRTTFISHYFKWALKICKWKPSSSALSAPCQMTWKCPQRATQDKTIKHNLEHSPSLTMAILSGEIFKLISDIIQARSEHLQSLWLYFIVTIIHSKESNSVKTPITLQLKQTLLTGTLTKLQKLCSQRTQQSIFRTFQTNKWILRTAW